MAMFGLRELKKALLGDSRDKGGERRGITGLTAYLKRDSGTIAAQIIGIGSADIEVATEKWFDEGQLIELILRKEGEPETGSVLEFSVQARVARQTAEGVELGFVLPPGMNLDLWRVLIRNLEVLTDGDQIAETFRTVRTVLFLYRLCGSGAEEAIHLFGGQLDADRTATLFKIAFGAEKLLDAEPDAGKIRAHPKLVATILRDGSWAPDEVITKLWVGLLVGSASAGAPDDSNEILAELLVHVTATQARILLHACERALSSAAEGEKGTEGPVVLGPREIYQVSGVNDPYKNATDLAYLYNLGLLRKLFDFTSYRDADSFDVTPSRLGVELYKHCHGSREKLDPQLVETAKEHVATFFPPPMPAAADNQTTVMQQSPSQE